MSCVDFKVASQIGSSYYYRYYFLLCLVLDATETRYAWCYLDWYAPILVDKDKFESSAASCNIWIQRQSGFAWQAFKWWQSSNWCYIVALFWDSSFDLMSIVKSQFVCVSLWWLVLNDKTMSWSKLQKRRHFWAGIRWKQFVTTHLLVMLAPSSSLLFFRILSHLHNTTEQGMLFSSAAP